MQLELNFFGKSEEEIRLDSIEAKMNSLSISQNKVRKKLFQEIHDLRNFCLELQKENQEMKEFLKNIK